MAEKPWPDPPQGARPGRPVRQIRPQRAELAPDLRDAFSIVWLYKWSILAITLLIVGVALFVSSRQTPVYESSAKVLVESVGDIGADSVTPRDPNLATEAELVRSAAVANIVAEDLDFDGDPTALLNDVSVDRPTDTEILEISYRHTNAREARRRADAFAAGYLDYRQETVTAEVTEATEAIDTELRVLRDRISDIQQELLAADEDDPRIPGWETETALLQTQILERQLARLALARASVVVGEIVQAASSPQTPVSPNHVVNGVFGLVAGLGLGVGLSFLRDRLSGRIRSAGEIEEHIQAPVLGSIPRVPAWRKRKEAFIVSLRQWQSPGSEAYRTLRTNVLSAASASGAKTIVISSAHDGEGKSATVANLGVVLARAEKRVTLVSADLRRPRLHEFFGLSGAPGLADVLAGRVPASQALQEVTLATSPWIELSTVRLRILPSGGVPEDPAELLASDRMETLMRKLAETSDIVLIDTPPVLPVTDALVVARVADAALLVVGPRSSTGSVMMSARQQLGNVGARVLGVVLNGPDPSIAQTYYSY